MREVAPLFQQNRLEREACFPSRVREGPGEGLKGHKARFARPLP